MTLEQFRTHLQEMDKALGTNYFDNGAKETAFDTFTYEFDGYITSKVQFFTNVVLQTFEGGTQSYGSVMEWKNSTMQALGYPAEGM
jgi:hypothetical protein